jgi:hypothetical protein
MSCTNCGNTIQNCTNPCAVTETNTAACETLPSQIENFTIHFFGTVVKTEVDDAVVWSLPCNLEVGLPNNPRAEGEGLACYFLRLFTDGITGLQGPQGETGEGGADGKNAFGVTVQGFSQPTIGAPNINILTAYNPCLTTGLYIFIQLSGWYLITHADGAGGLWLTLTRSSGGTADGAWVAAGKLVIPSGYPGNVGLTGATGAAGATGPQGPAGSVYTTSNGQTDPTTIAAIDDFKILIAFSEVDYTEPPNGTAELAVLLPAAGTYLITYMVQVNQSAASAQTVQTRLRNQTAGATLNGSTLSDYLTATTTSRHMGTTVLYTNPAGTPYIKVQAACDAANTHVLDKTQFFLGYVRIA